MLIWILVIASSVLLDQASKAIIVRQMDLHESIPLIKNVFSLTFIRNEGAAWGMFADHRWVFLVITGIAIIALPILLYYYRKEPFLFGFSLSLIIGGAIGNMIDRLFLGSVVDFFEFTFIDFPVFNVADICVTVGTVLMFIYLAFFDKTIFADKTKRKDNETDGAQNDSRSE